jgi:hypothetical protein
MDHGRPAARHGHAIAGDLVQNGALAGLQADGNAGDALAALDLDNAAAGLDPDAQRARLLRQRAGGLAAGVDNGGNLEPRLPQRDGGAVGVVVVGDDNGAVAGR